MADEPITSPNGTAPPAPANGVGIPKERLDEKNAQIAQLQATIKQNEPLVAGYQQLLQEKAKLEAELAADRARLKNYTAAASHGFTDPRVVGHLEQLYTHTMSQLPESARQPIDQWMAAIVADPSRIEDPVYRTYITIELQKRAQTSTTTTPAVPPPAAPATSPTQAAPIPPGPTGQPLPPSNNGVIPAPTAPASLTPQQMLDLSRDPKKFREWANANPDEYRRLNRMT